MQRPHDVFDVPPLNRSERFWSATVLPHLLAFNQFQYLRPFLNLVRSVRGEGPLQDPVDPEQVRFETEYSLKNAEAPLRRDGHMLDEPARGDTPDIMVWEYGNNGGLYCVEVKMFDAVSAADISSQLANQHTFVFAHLIARYGVPRDRIYHVALLPSERVDEWDQGHGLPIITWERVAGIFKHALADDYFFRALGVALELYRHRAGAMELKFGQNMDAKITGQALLALLGSPNAPNWVGRLGGPAGKKFQEDLRTGKWRDYPYEVSSSDAKPPHNNWFSFASFSDAVRKAAHG